MNQPWVTSSKMLVNSGRFYGFWGLLSILGNTQKSKAIKIEVAICDFYNFRPAAVCEI